MWLKTSFHFSKSLDINIDLDGAFENLFTRLKKVFTLLILPTLIYSNLISVNFLQAFLPADCGHPA